MVVIALASHDLHRTTPTPASHRSLKDIPNYSASGLALALDPTTLTPPTTGTIVDDDDLETLSTEDDGESEAGPSSRNSLHYADLSHRSQPSQSRHIPPPPNPRRHRSGVLMSRVRAHSGSQANPPMPVSKSWGELSSIGLRMSSIKQRGKEKEKEVEGDDEAEDEDGKAKRSVSDGWRSRDEEDESTVWDNR